MLLPLVHASNGTYDSCDSQFLVFHWYFLVISGYPSQVEHLFIAIVLTVLTTCVVVAPQYVSFSLECSALHAGPEAQH
jgi:hypothetical protein